MKALHLAPLYILMAVVFLLMLPLLVPAVLLTAANERLERAIYRVHHPEPPKPRAKGSSTAFLRFLRALTILASMPWALSEAFQLWLVEKYGRLTKEIQRREAEREAAE